MRIYLAVSGPQEEVKIMSILNEKIVIIKTQPIANAAWRTHTKAVVTHGLYFYAVPHLTPHYKCWSHDSLAPALRHFPPPLFFLSLYPLSPLSPSSTGSPPPSRLDICCLATPAPIRASGLSSPLQWNQPCMQMADIESSHITIKLYRTTDSMHTDTN